MRWEQGRATIERMLADQHLQRIPANRRHADRLLAQARRHLAAAETICGIDPQGAYVLVYDAARKALAAVLENQGLRATTNGGHIAVHVAARAQLDPPMGQILRPFTRMRRQRNEVEYASNEVPDLTTEDVREDRPRALALVDLADRILDQMSPF